MLTRKDLSALAFAVVIAAAATTGAPMRPCAQTTWNVPADFPTIQGAINGSSAGDTIVISTGTYAENLIVDKSLVIYGTDKAATILIPALSAPNPCTGSSLCGGTASNIILVRADNVLIHDLTLDGDNPALTSGIVRNGADLDARNGIIVDHSAGSFTGLEALMPLR